MQRFSRPGLSLCCVFKPRGISNTTSDRGFSRFTLNEASLTVPQLSASFPYVWLRDSCQSNRCIHPATLQKLHRTSDIPLNIKPKPNGVSISEKELSIAWIDGHNSTFSIDFLERHSSGAKLSAFHRDFVEQSWNSFRISNNTSLFQQYDALQLPQGLLAAIKQLSEHGLLFIRGVPSSEISHEKCELLKLVAKFGELRETFYGRVWDVQNIRGSTNIAYTNLDLGLHMDLLYFQHPPDYQILHCLRNRVTGGTSIFVDTLHAAEVLKQEFPTDFGVLTSTLVPFHYINNGHHLHYEHPTVELEHFPRSTIRPKNSIGIKHVNYSPPFQAPLLLNTPPEFYSAMKRFTDILNRPGNMFQYLLKEGDAVLFNNRRVLHARTAFKDDLEDTSLLSPEYANRWLKGCYFEGDAMWDKMRVLSAAEVL